MRSRQRGDREYPRFECEVPATNRSLHEVRARFATWLAGVPDPRRDAPDLVLAMSELVAAAVRGGTHQTQSAETLSGTPETIVAHAWLEDGAVAIEVVAAQSIVRREANDAERGFAIVASITDALSVRGDGDRTLVCARKW